MQQRDRQRDADAAGRPVRRGAPGDGARSGRTNGSGNQADDRRDEQSTRQLREVEVRDVKDGEMNGGKMTSRRSVYCGEPACFTLTLSAVASSA